MKINYEELTEITVKNQEELDAIPLDFKGRIYIEFGDGWCPAIVRNKFYLRVVAWENSSVVARENSSVEAWENSSVEAWENSSVEARGNSSVVARENSSVEAWENSSVEAWENSSVEAWENSSVEARGNSSVVARGNSSVVAWENSSVVAWENSSVVARGNSSVVARGNSSVVAWGNSSVEAWENSSVEAWENSSVEARGNSSVVARGNSQVQDLLQGAKIQVSGNARIIYNPKTVDEFIDFYGIEHTKTKAIFYKAVRKENDILVSDYDSDFEYVIGELQIEPNICTDIDESCGTGIHISHLDWALNFGANWGNLAIIEVEVDIKDIVLPKMSDGKVRTSKVKTLREVPLSECSIYGKILDKRIRK